jgi:hypothetical protein
MEVRDYRELIVWQKGMDLVIEIQKMLAVLLNRLQ